LVSSSWQKNVVIANTGAATFSSSVTAQSVIINTGSATNGLTITANGNNFSGAEFNNSDTGTSARAQLQINSDAASGYFFATSSTNTSSALGGRAQTVGIFTASGNTSGGLAFLARNAAGYITFHTGGSTERLRIAANGAATFSSSVTATNLYLGSLTNEQLMISGTGSRGIGVSTITSGDPYFRLYNNTTIVGDMWWGRSGNFQGINSLGAGSITAINPFGGNVLIGTTTDAGFKLDVNGTLRAVGTIRSNQGYAYSNGIINITGGSSSWIFLGTISIAQGGNTAVITIEGGSGYNADEGQNGSARIFIRTSNGSPNGSGWYYSATLSQTGFSSAVASSCIITQTNSTTYNVYVNFGPYSGNTYYKVEGSEFTWTASNSNYGATAPTGGQTLTNVFKVLSASTFSSSVGISGNVDIGGNTELTGRLRIQGGSDQGSQLSLWANSNGNTFLAGFNFAIHTGSNNSRTQKFFISNTGDATFSSSVTASSFFESSDSRIKILLEDELDYLSIANVSAKYYEKNGKAELGYFAQDFESILPSAISKNEDGYLNLSYREVHTAKIAALEKEVKELKEKLKNK
jgi:hypothetical protein